MRFRDPDMEALAAELEAEGIGRVLGPLRWAVWRSLGRLRQDGTYGHAYSVSREDRIVGATCYRELAGWVEAWDAREAMEAAIVAGLRPPWNGYAP